LDWFTTASYDLFVLLFDWQKPTTGTLLRLAIGLFSFPLIFALLLRAVNKMAHRIPVVIHQDDAPEPVPALVMFLSPPGEEAQYLRRAADGEVDTGLNNRIFRESIKRSWRMPVEALAYHRVSGTLRAIVVIPSADAESSEKLQLGTYRDVALFRNLVSRLTDGEVEVYTLPDREDGVDYEQAQALKDAVEEAYELLVAKGFCTGDILVDITGGQKVPTIAGAAVALSEDRQFQYVSTRDYRIRTYDITYLS
jgi:hypothetical protein